MSFEDFQRRLPMVDWFYDYADDDRAYARGRKQVANYQKLAEDKGSKWVEAFKKARKDARSVAWQALSFVV